MSNASPMELINGTSLSGLLDCSMAPVPSKGLDRGLSIWKMTSGCESIRNRFVNIHRHSIGKERNGRTKNDQQGRIPLGWDAQCYSKVKLIQPQQQVRKEECVATEANTVKSI